MASGYCKCGPFRVNMMPQGMLKPYILFLVSKKPMHGFEIMDEISYRSHGVWASGPAAIYPALAWLRAKGYVKPAWSTLRSEKARRQYRITRKGAAAVMGYRDFEKEWFENLGKLKDLFK